MPVELMFACANAKVIKALLNEPVGHFGILAEDLGQPLIARCQAPSFLAQQDAGGQARLAPRAIRIAAFTIHGANMEEKPDSLQVSVRLAQQFSF